MSDDNDDEQLQQGNLVLLPLFILLALCAAVAVIRRSYQRCIIRSQITGHEPTNRRDLMASLEYPTENSAARREDTIKSVSPRTWYRVNKSYRNVSRTGREEVGAPELSEVVRVTVAREGSGESGDDAQLDSLSPSPPYPSYNDATVSLRDRDPTSDTSLLTKQSIGGKGTAREHTSIALTTPIEYAPSTQHDVVWV
jgi:hypothetical protein